MGEQYITKPLISAPNHLRRLEERVGEEIFKNVLTLTLIEIMQYTAGKKKRENTYYEGKT